MGGQIIGLKLEEPTTPTPGGNEKVDQRLLHRILLWNSHDCGPSTTSQASSNLKINADEFEFLMRGCRWQLTQAKQGPQMCFVGLQSL